MDLRHTALLLIDLQKEENSAVSGMDAIARNAQKLVATCREIGIRIIYTRHISRADAVGLVNKEPLNEQGKPIYYCSDEESIEIIDAIKPLPGDIVIDKYRYSGFYESSLDLMLRSLQIKHLLIGGVLTDCCLMTTVFDAYFRDYQINLIQDISGTTTMGAHMASIMMMANWIYDLEVYDTEELMKKLRGQEYHAWKSNAPDEVQFTPDNMREVFNKLSKR